MTLSGYVGLLGTEHPDVISENFLTPWKSSFIKYLNF